MNNKFLNPVLIFLLIIFSTLLLSETALGNGNGCRGETAFGGNYPGGGNAWWYYFDTQGLVTQKIYAGQYEMIGGSVYWNDTNLIITLGNNWYLKQVNEPVKVQGYNTLPPERPAAGLFTLYKGTNLTVPGDGSQYYVIHLDVEYCDTLTIITSQEQPTEFRLYTNYPNPFNPSTSIRFNLPKTSNAKLIIYDILGKEVTTLVNEKLITGSYEVDWNASGYPNGVYFYKLTTNDYFDVKKMVLIK